jgi:hypothetical protein
LTIFCATTRPDLETRGIAETTLLLRRLWSIYKRTAMAPASREAIFIFVLGGTRSIQSIWCARSAECELSWPAYSRWLFGGIPLMGQSKSVAGRRLLHQPPLSLPWHVLAQWQVCGSAWIGDSNCRDNPRARIGANTVQIVKPFIAAARYRDYGFVCRRSFFLQLAATLSPPVIRMAGGVLFAVFR